MYLQQAAPSRPGLPLETALAMGEDLVWVDVRSEAEFARRHIPEAISLRPDNADQQMHAYQHLFLNQTKRFVVYGDDTSHADVESVMEMLKGMGLPHVHRLEGGWRAWLESGR